jgi:[ribosomal protein S5]-alanine N-acetyltransferase
MIKFEAERLILRNFTLDDFDAVHKYASDPEVSKYEPWGPNSEQETQEYLERLIKSEEQSPRRGYELAVILKDSGELIGSGRIGPDKHLINQISIGYTINPKYQGQGYATELTCKLIEVGFSELKAKLVFATCDVLNKPSKRVMEKAGMTQVDLIKDHMEIKGRMRDSYRFEIKK